MAKVRLNPGQVVNECLLVNKHDLRRAVPPRRDVFGHEGRVLVRCRVEPTAQAEVADLQLTVGVDKQVARFEVSMNYRSRVDVLHACAES